MFRDFTGVYSTQDQIYGSINKQLTLGYDFIGNDFLDLYITDKNSIELHQL